MAVRDSDQRLTRIMEARSRRDCAYLRTALLDPDHRPLVAETLGKLGCVEAVPEMARLLDANDPQARMAATRALGWLRAVDVAPRLTTAAEEDRSNTVRQWALIALGEIGHTQSLPLLLRYLDSERWGLRAAAAIGLGHLGLPDALPALQRVKRRDWWRSKPYRDAIASIGHGVA